VRLEAAMIQFILVQNRQGITRLSKYYRQYTDDERVRLEDEIHRLETGRDAKFTNFVEVRHHARARDAAARPVFAGWASRDVQLVC
jgi:hypothetical protein